MVKNWKDIEARREPNKKVKYDVKFQGNQTTNTKKEVLYEYYVCDNCDAEIKIIDNKKKNTEERTGGLVNIRLNYYKTLKLALCNKCLNPVKEQLNEYYEINV
ncbi:MAG: hypothetical protein IJW20_07815 [Clostridia bacterium]|nr:hypothetical protein [Clostridia bacterium]